MLSQMSIFDHSANWRHTCFQSVYYHHITFVAVSSASSQVSPVKRSQFHVMFKKLLIGRKFWSKLYKQRVRTPKKEENRRKKKGTNKPQNTLVLSLFTLQVYDNWGGA